MRGTKKFARRKRKERNKRRVEGDQTQLSDGRIASKVPAHASSIFKVSCNLQRMRQSSVPIQ